MHRNSSVLKLLGFAPRDVQSVELDSLLTTAFGNTSKRQEFIDNYGTEKSIEILKEYVSTF